MANIDTNISNYTIPELMAIVDLDPEDCTPEHIIENTNSYIRKYKTKNPSLSIFFKEIQKYLLEEEKKEEEEEEEAEDNDLADYLNHTRREGFASMANANDWFTNDPIPPSDKNQASKITDRAQKIQVFENEQLPMSREQIATSDTFNLPVKQDSLNPNLKNTITRFLNLDSTFRQYTNGPDSTATDYTCDLSDTLKNTLSLSVYSYQIPFSWYVIDIPYGNTCLWVYDLNSDNTVTVSVTPGNYSWSGFKTELTDAFGRAGFTVTDPASSFVKYNENTGMITLNLNGGTWTDPDSLSPLNNTFTITPSTQIIFFDFTNTLQGVSPNANNYIRINHHLNSTLGWIMGYRLPYIYVDPSGNIAPAILDLNGTKYIMLSIDDYNQNHVNNSLVSISKFSNTLKMPSYYSSDIPFNVITADQQVPNLNNLVDGQTQPQNGLLIAGKYQYDYTPTQVVLPSAPRTLTNAQLYTINSINNNNNNLTNYLPKAPTTSDILAVLPIKTSVGLSTGSLLIEFSGSLQNNVRTYFGPVNIDRMAVKLIDDKGNILNLNGNDWCVTLIAECLYQY